MLDKTWFVSSEWQRVTCFLRALWNFHFSQKIVCSFRDLGFDSCVNRGGKTTLVKTRLKYKGNGHYFGDKFVLAITFYQLHIFRNRFLCWSAFLLDFKKTPIKTIFMAITYVCHNSQYWQMAIMAVMAHHYAVINMVFMGS